jgi:hypothetical protein
MTQFAECMLPTEIWRQIFVHADFLTKVTLSQVCRHFEWLIKPISADHLMIGLGCTAEHVQLLYRIQPVHQFESHHRISPIEISFKRAPPKDSLLCLTRQPDIERLLANSAAFRHLQTLVIHIHCSVMPNFHIRDFKTLQTLELHRSFTRQEWKNGSDRFRCLPIATDSDADALPKLERLILYGFHLKHPLLVCPSLRVFKCHTLQWELLVTDDLNGLFRTRTAHPLQKLHLWDHLPFEPHFLILPRQPMESVFRSLYKMTITADAPKHFCFPPHYPFVRRLSYKLPLIDRDWNEDGKSVEEIAISLNKEVDLDDVSVTFNGVRLKANFRSYLRLFSYLPLLFKGSRMLELRGMEIRAADRIRARSIQRFERDQCKLKYHGQDRLWSFGTLRELNVMGGVEQHLLNRMPNSLGSLCSLELRPKRSRGVPVVKYDLSFVSRLVALNKLVLDNFKLEEQHQLLDIIRDLPSLHDFTCNIFVLKCIKTQMLQQWAQKVRDNPDRQMSLQFKTPLLIEKRSLAKSKKNVMKQYH